jgi:hypothetical protein
MPNSSLDQDPQKRIQWENMKLIDQPKKRKVGANKKKRKLYKKYLNLGVSGIDPTAKDIKEDVSR